MALCSLATEVAKLPFTTQLQAMNIFLVASGARRGCCPYDGPAHQNFFTRHGSALLEALNRFEAIIAVAGSLYADTDVMTILVLHKPTLLRSSLMRRALSGVILRSEGRAAASFGYLMGYIDPVQRLVYSRPMYACDMTAVLTSSSKQKKYPLMGFVVRDDAALDAHLKQVRRLHARMNHDIQMGYPGVQIAFTISKVHV